MFSLVNNLAALHDLQLRQIQIFLLLANNDLAIKHLEFTATSSESMTRKQIRTIENVFKSFELKILTRDSLILISGWARKYEYLCV